MTNFSDQQPYLGIIGAIVITLVTLIVVRYCGRAVEVGEAAEEDADYLFAMQDGEVFEGDHYGRLQGPNASEFLKRKYGSQDYGDGRCD